MRLKVFDTIDDTLRLLDSNMPLYREAVEEIHDYLKYLFVGQDMIVDMNSRIKSKESLREKIIRNRFYVENDTAQQILDHLSDLIGFIIECRFT